MSSPTCCPRCNGQLLMQSEPASIGWQRVPTCLQCSYQVFERVTDEPVHVRRQPVLPKVR